jgi:hypothetical protein
MKVVTGLILFVQLDEEKCEIEVKVSAEGLQKAFIVINAY